MEPLWSPVVATGGNQWQMARPRRPLEQAKTVAVGCDRLPESFHGKQGVCRGLPPVAGGPLPAKEGVDSHALRGSLGEPLTHASHCCAIIQILVLLRVCKWPTSHGR